MKFRVVARFFAFTLMFLFVFSCLPSPLNLEIKTVKASSSWQDNIVSYDGTLMFYQPSFTATEIYEMFGRDPAYMTQSEIDAYYYDHTEIYQARLREDAETLAKWGVKHVSIIIPKNDEARDMWEYFASIADISTIELFWNRISEARGVVNPEDSIIWDENDRTAQANTLGGYLAEVTNATKYPNLAAKVKGVWTELPWFDTSDFTNNSLVYSIWNDYLEREYTTIANLNSTWNGDLGANEDAFGKITMPGNNMTNHPSVDDVRAWDFFELSSEMWYNGTKAFKDKANEYGLKMGWYPATNMWTRRSNIVSDGSCWGLNFLWRDWDFWTSYYHSQSFWYMSGKSNATYEQGENLKDVQYHLASRDGRIAYWQHQDFWVKGGRAYVNGTVDTNPSEWFSPTIPYKNNSARPHEPYWGAFAPFYLDKSKLPPLLVVYDYDIFIRSSTQGYIQGQYWSWSYPNAKAIDNQDANLTVLNNYDATVFVTNDNETVHLMLDYVSQAGKKAFWILPNDAKHNSTHIRLRDRHGNAIYKSISILGLSSIQWAPDVSAPRRVAKWVWTDGNESAVKRDAYNYIDFYQCFVGNLDYGSAWIINSTGNSYVRFWQINQTNLYTTSIEASYIYTIWVQSGTSGENDLKNRYAGDQIAYTVREILGLPTVQHHILPEYLRGEQLSTLDNYIQLNYYEYGNTALQPFGMSDFILYGGRYKYNGTHLLFDDNYKAVSGFVQSWTAPVKIYETNKAIMSASFSNNALTFTVTAPSNSTSVTKIYCGNQGKPLSIKVNGKDYGSIPYDANTKILTLTIQHSSDANIEVRWAIAPLSKPLGYVRQIWTGFLPVLFVIISVALLNALLKGEMETREFTWAIIGLAIGTAVLMILLQIVEGL